MLYVIFHLNLMYSSVSPALRKQVVDKSYRPLLEFARRYGPVGVEATAETLAAIEEVDAEWIPSLRNLVALGRCEFVGSGYAQVIGPLVPVEVNEANLRLGNLAYQRHQLPARIAYVNEQVFSTGIVPLLAEAGYEALVMEWNNPFRLNPSWDPAFRFLPQRALGSDGTTLPLIWNDSINFQKLQAYAHAEMDLDEYVGFVEARTARAVPVAFPLYGGDVEVFDFRPGRFETEAPLKTESEWERLGLLFAEFHADDRYQLVAPSAVLALLDEPGAGKPLDLSSPEEPIPVKKQPKYNVSRWAATGRGDVSINTECWRLFEVLRSSDDDRDWAELCSLWASDFRTHITEDRWTDAWARLGALRDRLSAGATAPEVRSPRPTSGKHPTVTMRGRWLKVETPSIRVRFNVRRGLSIDALETIGAPPLMGSLAHGYYDDISLGADFYSGHTVVEMPGRRRVTDLGPASTTWDVDAVSGAVVVRGQIQTPIGTVDKEILVVEDDEPSVCVRSRFDWCRLPVATIRTGFVTLLPDAFDPATLFFRTHNGGREPETFPVSGRTIAHDRAISALCSTTQVLGATRGWVELGDYRRVVRVEIDRTVSAAVPMVTFRPVGDRFFLRLAWTLGEYDDTTIWGDRDAPVGIDLKVVPLVSAPDGPGS